MHVWKTNQFGVGISPVVKLLVCIILSYCGRKAAGLTEGLDIEQIAERDLYGVLELESGVSASDVKTAYRKLARKWHPDKNPADTQSAQSKFAEVAEAYEILSDETSRELYDRARALRAARHHAERHNKDGQRMDEDAWRPWDEGLSNAHWHHPYGEGMGEADDFFVFGNSFAGVAGGIGGFDAAFGSDPFFTGGGSGMFEFHPRDPIELFDAFFSGTGFDGHEDQHQQNHFNQWQQEYPFRHDQQQYQQSMHDQTLHKEGRAQDAFEQGYWRPSSHEESPWAEWIGQDFEQYHDYVDGGGSMHRRVITTAVLRDGTSFSTAQDFVLDEQSNTWTATTDTFEYHGQRIGPWGRSYGEEDDDRPVDNVLRMNEYLGVGHSISSVDRKFTVTLEHNCNFVLNYTRRGSTRHLAEQVQVWETGSFDADGRCFAVIQDNGMLVVMSGDDPSAPGNVLWSNNRAYVGWFRQSSFHAYILPNGNLVVAQGDSPMHPAAQRCVWGAFGCPGDGGMQEWKLLWIALKTQADEIWCRVMGYDWCDGGSGDEGARYSNTKYHDHFCNVRDPSNAKNHSGDGTGKGWHLKSKEKAAGVLSSGAEHLRRLANDGWDKLKDAWERVKAATEETAHAASRPRHW